FQISNAVIEPLIRPSEDGTKLQPGLASSWRFNSDNTVLTIRLNRKATFSDGTPVTTEDVAFSVETWKSGESYGSTYGVIDHTTIVDSRTIELHLVYPDAALSAYLSWAAAGVMPDEFGGRSAQEYYQDPIGAGAFTVESWSPNGLVELEKSPHYYRPGRPHVDEIVSSFAADPNSVSLQIRAGQIDLADEVLPVAAISLADDQVKAEPVHLTPVLLMNTKDDALSDVAVRRAIAYGIDYDAIVASALKGYGVPPTGPLPPNSANWAPPSEPYFAHDPDQAESLLSSASNPPDTVALTYPNDPSSALMAQVIQQNLDDIGIDVELQAADSATEFANLSSGNYQLGIFSTNAISPDVSDPAWYVAATKTMFTGYPTGSAVKALAAYAAAETSQERKAEVVKLQDIWADDVPYVALAHTSALEAQGSGVHGVHVTPWGSYYFDSVWKSS
ncbi:MAG: ABC transporter substrate-binding protein, partial [Nocardioidaceae bacterium]